MTTEFVIEGPKGVNIGQIDTTPQFCLNSRLVTSELNATKYRIYRYVQYLTTVHIGTPVLIGSLGKILHSANASNAVGLHVGVSQVTLTSPTSTQTSLNTWVQTGGWFGGGALSGPGIYTNSAVANSELYLTTTDSTCSTTGMYPVASLGAKALTTGSTSNVLAFAPEELAIRKDLLA